VRANQGMIGEFRYWESHRELGEINMGQGVITEYGRIDPYPFNPEQPSMSVNSQNGVWQNLNVVGAYDTTRSTYGFAVDYRGARPIVHVIVGDEWVQTLTLNDVFTPLYPLLYATSATPGTPDQYQTANFGALPFEQDVDGALQTAGIDSTGLVLGWGDVNADTDGDSLLDQAEGIYGADPADADSDDDGLLDGSEVHDQLTDPILADTDGDGVPDGYEVAYESDPLVQDETLDRDNDGYFALSELLVGSHPQTAVSKPGSLEQGRLSLVDKHATVDLSPDLLTATFTDTARRLVRGDKAVLPGSGVYYFEGHRDGFDIGTNGGFGVSTALEPVSSWAGASSESVGIRFKGYVMYQNSGQVSTSPEIKYARDYGFVVDYRGTNPIVHIIARNKVVYSLTLVGIVDPVYMTAYGEDSVPSIPQSINPGDDLLQRPFRYDPRQALTDAGQTGAAELVRGWYEGTAIADPDPDLDGLDNATEIGLGTDPNNPDSDNDGLRDGDEITAATNPLNPDTDGDGINDGDEVAAGTDPNDPNDPVPPPMVPTLEPFGMTVLATLFGLVGMYYSGVRRRVN
jgi:hypothetical protein